MTPYTSLLTYSMTFLDDILKVKRESVQRRKGRSALQELRSRIADAEPTRRFQKALRERQEGAPRLIAEIKKASPSKGIIREKFQPVEIARIYEGEGAAAVSVLTEEHFFLGKPSYLKEVRSAIALPLLKKDFILDEFQVYEARAWGADALLLIAALLERQQAIDYFHLARELSLDILVEVHDEKELEQVVDWAPVIGINNRDLRTFKTDLETTFRLLREIPSILRKDRVVISESGIHSRKEVERLYDAGVEAMLIGETFMVAEKMADKMKELLGR
ncbi:MAG: indole-3-glycerol phosphate synthase TrpC [Candidatus Manganitrophus sp.]|nr:indole-3-glycerol phosphate synthase TrpC [Candidatus Manganitrophus sp.]WDT71101.1 MAG: indole-3-glycerol phosphate synthase TrpC [Candidatus Manganitrophus sp.]WDT81610.1 MAG: indole-3-glycerol phosphate synthase TrpC [Candidatus Manganitrophus sp.]